MRRIDGNGKAERFKIRMEGISSLIVILRYRDSSPGETEETTRVVDGDGDGHDAA